MYTRDVTRQNMCGHEAATQIKKVVNPPTNCVPFTARISVCKSCGVEFATTSQRKKNRSNFNQASKRYHINAIETHGIYY